MRVHLLLTRRRSIWRVRILIPGEPRPCWRTYRAEDYPTPEAVARRCVEGLARRSKNQEHANSHDERKQDVTQHGLPLRVRWEFWGRLEWLQEHTLPPLKDFQYY